MPSIRIRSAGQIPAPPSGMPPSGPNFIVIKLVYLDEHGMDIDPAMWVVATDTRPPVIVSKEFDNATAAFAECNVRNNVPSPP